MNEQRFRNYQLEKANLVANARNSGNIGAYVTGKKALQEKYPDWEELDKFEEEWNEVRPGISNYILTYGGSNKVGDFLEVLAKVMLILSLIGSIVIGVSLGSLVAFLASALYCTIFYVTLWGISEIISLLQGMFDIMNKPST